MTQAERLELPANSQVLAEWPGLRMVRVQREASHRHPFARPSAKYFLIDEAGTKLARLSDPRFIRALTLR